MDTAALRSIEELLVSEMRHQTKQDTDLTVTLQLQLQDKKGTIFILRGSEKCPFIAYRTSVGLPQSTVGYYFRFGSPVQTCFFGSS